MSLYTLAGQLPRHHYVWVDSSFTHSTPQGFVRAVWFGLVSNAGRAWGCTVMLESGAVYRALPPHAIAFVEQPEPSWSIQDAQTWDCYGYGFTTIEYDYLAGLRCSAKANDTAHNGEYLFTAAPVGDGFSQYPEQAKEFMFIKLDNNRLTVQPTNHVVFKDLSFTDCNKRPTGLRRMESVYRSE